jgi:peptidoglycan/xylan/chitin deacetylase (PgdA/CDA1 family)
MTTSPTTWSWPEGKHAAVSLGYDDGNPDNLDQAMPDLEAAGFRGTFYLHLARGDVQARVADWRAAYARGHEIGNHTWFHNARTDLYGVRHSWVTKPLEEYTQADMAAEIARAADWLDEQIGPDPHRSFTYPCGHLTLGVPPDRQAYADAVATRCRFARTGTPDVVVINEPLTVDLTLIPTIYFHENRVDQLTAAIDQAVYAGGWACLGFHGVGGGSHTTARETHQALMHYLADAAVWVAPVGAVAAWIAAHR